MIRRAAVAVAAMPLIVTVELCRRGYGAPLAFGVRQWCRARPDTIDRWKRTNPDHEPDSVG